MGLGRGRDALGEVDGIGLAAKINNSCKILPLIKMAVVLVLTLTTTPTMPLANIALFAAVVVSSKPHNLIRHILAPGIEIRVKKHLVGSSVGQGGASL